MTRRVVIGKRANGDKGIFVSPAGVDAYTAADSQLVLDVASKIPQLLLNGFVSSSQTVPLGFSQQPFVILTGSANLSAIPGYSQVGPARPAPLFNTDPQASAILLGGSSMVVSCGARTNYQVYNYPF